MKNEIFKPIIFNGKITNYIVGDMGTVININTNKILTPRLENNGRYCITICIDGVAHKKAVARWIALAHLSIREGYTENELEADHIDGDPTNDVLTNIQFLTREENSEKEYLVENKYLRGEKNGNAKMTDILARQIAIDSIAGLKPKQLSKKYNVSSDSIEKIRERKTWTHVTDDLNMDGLINKRSNIQRYSSELKNSIKILIESDITIKNKKICRLLNIERTYKIDLLINNIRRKIKNNEGSTTIESDDMYDDSKYYVINIR